MRLAPAAASAGTPPDSNLLPCCLPLLRCCLALLTILPQANAALKPVAESLQARRHCRLHRVDLRHGLSAGPA